ncbi:DUF3054 domain-containing protein [Timonella sp. A28]|uniref:DUF3054 domain-containing protein n=1 Tax=Timonella sp. A28 TaxID=3442640 RepID=UPI003EB74884
MKKTWLWAALDVTFVLLFAASGRSSHAEENTIVGVLTTAWPFLTGLAIAWLVTRQWRNIHDFPVALRIWPSACALAVITWGVGLLLRLSSGQTNSGGFPLVALGFLVLMLVGWRIVWSSMVKIQRKRVHGSVNG